MRNPDAILFDLDGTLIDTAPDMASALNRLLAREGRAKLAPEIIRPHVSNGAAALVRLGFGTTLAEAERERLHRAFLDSYADDIATASRPFPGMPALLDAIEDAGMRWGVVTNKPDWLTLPLMAALDLTARASCIVSGNTLARNKPDPAPIHHACELAGTCAARCVYVGDAERDIVAGRAAGSRTLIALFGYIEPGANPATWRADGMLDHPEDLWRYVDRTPAPRETG